MSDPSPQVPPSTDCSSPGAKVDEDILVDDDYKHIKMLQHNAQCNYVNYDLPHMDSSMNAHGEDDYGNQIVLSKKGKKIGMILVDPIQYFKS